jgi:hypothetical protein
VERECISSNPIKQQTRERRCGFPVWSWLGHKFEEFVLYPIQIMSILQSQRHAMTRIQWPWDIEEENSAALSVNDYTVLSIDMELVSMTRPDRVGPLLFSNDAGGQLKISLLKYAYRRSVECPSLDRFSLCPQASLFSSESSFPSETFCSESFGCGFLSDVGANFERSLIGPPYL